MRVGSKIKASNPRSKNLIDGKEYKIEWISIGGKIAVKDESGRISPYNKNNFDICGVSATSDANTEPNDKKLTFGDLDVGDKFIDFPTAGDGHHGGYCGAYNVFIKFSESKITKHSLLQNNAINESNGSLSNFPDTMNVIKLNG